jgi:hypothetical protein
MHEARAGISIGLLVVALALVAAGGALALQAPGRTKVYPGQVTLVALNDASFAFVVARSKNDCDHVELWNIDVKGLWRFGKPGPCTNLGSTGAGISALGVSGNRALWVRYNGGNFRDWQLMTATTTQRVPKQLRFVEQDVELSTPPFVIGDSTDGIGIPYAAGKQVVLLGANGAAVFKRTEPARVAAITAGLGSGGAVVAVLLDTGEVDMLKQNGSLAWSVTYPAGAVQTIALAPKGLIVGLASNVEIRKPSGATTTVALPTGARMTDYAEGRILYARPASVGLLGVTSGKSTPLLLSTAAGPVVATLDAHGLAWGKGNTANYACAGCIGS